MAFGRLGSLGTGFGRLGARAHGGTAAIPSGSDMLAGETDGFATSFINATDASRVAVKVASVTTSQGLDTFYQNAGTSPKMVFDVAGNLVWSPHNLVLQSETMDNASWNKGAQVAITADATAAPTGAVTADKLANLNTASSNKGMLASTISFSINNTYTFAVWAKAAEWSWIAIEDRNTATRKTYFDLGTGAVGTINAAHSGATITSGGNGWYKCAITWVSPDTASNTPVIYLQTANAQGVVTGVVGAGVYLWGAQCNRGATLSTYLPTTTAARAGLAVDYDLAAHTPRGLLVELAATNLALNNATLSTQTITVSTLTTYVLSFWGTGTVTLTGASTAGPLAGSSATTRVSLSFATSGTSLTLTVSGTVSNAQLELGTAPTSLIPTLAASVTRVADNYTFLLSTIPALGSAYSIYCRFSTPVIANAKHAVAVTDGTVNEYAGFLANTTARLAVLDGGVAVGAIVGPTLVANTAVSAAARIKLNDCAMSVGGGAAAFDTTVTLPTVTEVRFGGTGNNVASTGSFYIEKLAIINARGWTDAELVGKSAT
jgi:hypothetical protein